MNTFSTQVTLSPQEPLYYGLGVTPIGPGLIVWSKAGIVMLHLQQSEEPDCEHIISATFSGNTLLRSDQQARTLLDQAFKYGLPGPKQSAAHACAQTIPNQPARAYQLLGTPFQLKVWQGLLEIPFGQVRTYGALADALGHPGAARAVGTAIAANKLAFVVPCHRVVRATGETGQYRWGAEQKTRLLAWEAQQLADSSADR
jgi:O-6-methylguanine DNA methyltransferase